MAFTAEEAFRCLAQAHAGGRLAHAYLITGPEGCGKRALASRLAGLILEDASGAPLQNPDAHTAEPESKSRRILIDQIRELEHALQMRSSFGRSKVAIIYDADRLHGNAANAFLKTLEEPPQNSHLLLLSAQPEQLLETIISRCLEVQLRQTAKPAIGPLQRKLLDRLQAFAARQQADLVAAFSLARDFQECLTTAKTALKAQAEADLKSEAVRYKQTSDAGHWLEQREAFYDGLTEARYQRERASLLSTLELWWGDVLRQQHGSAGLDFPDYAAATATLAARFSTLELLSRAAALQELRENLGRSGVQEQLAVECAFLKAFGG